MRLSEYSDDISQRGDALVELATVLGGAGRADEAAAAFRGAIALYERKGNVVSAARAEAMSESLEPRARAADR